LRKTSGELEQFRRPELKGLEPQAAASRRRGFPAVVEDPEILKVFTDSEAREKLVAYLLPVLCLALLDPKPEIRILSAIHFLYLGADARSAIQALRDALSDQDPRMRKVAEIVIESIETGGLRGRSS
jgi:hypothetical protein